MGGGLSPLSQEVPQAFLPPGSSCQQASPDLTEASYEDSSAPSGPCAAQSPLTPRRLESTFGCRSAEQMPRQPGAGVASVEGEQVPEAAADWTLSRKEGAQLLQSGGELPSRC